MSLEPPTYVPRKQLYMRSREPDIAKTAWQRLAGLAARISDAMQEKFYIGGFCSSLLSLALPQSLVGICLPLPRMVGDFVTARDLLARLKRARTREEFVHIQERMESLQGLPLKEECLRDLSGIIGVFVEGERTEGCFFEETGRVRKSLETFLSQYEWAIVGYVVSVLMLPIWVKDHLIDRKAF